MGITYENKPDFIERLIEVGSQHFFMSMGNVCFAAAEAEIGEHIGLHKAAHDHAEKSLWHLRKTLELYVGLTNSLANLATSDRAKKILKEFDFQRFSGDIKTRATIQDESRQWEKFVASSKRIDPVGTIKDFISEVSQIEPPLVRLVEELSAGKMNPVTIHQCMAAFVGAMTFGQYIAEFNRDTKERFSQ